MRTHKHMSNTRVPKQKSVRNSSVAKSVGRIRFCLWLACFCVAWLFGIPVQAWIATSGSVNPTYPGGNPDPWNVGGLLYVAYTANGGMDVFGGSVVNNTHGYIARSGGGLGWVTIDGAGSSWNNSGFLSIGHLGAGSGILDVRNGGRVTSGACDIVAYGTVSGMVTVSGPGSSWNNSGWLHVWGDGFLSLNIHSGGGVSNGECQFGITGTTATAIVDGAGSYWENTEGLTLGDSTGNGVGSLTISDGGSVYVGRPSLGGAGYLIVSQPDGTNGGSLYIYNGSTLMNHPDAIVGYGKAILGDSPNEWGWAIVDGTGSEWTNSGYLSVGNFGTGTLNVQNGGSVSNTAGWLGYGSAGTGTVTVTGIDSSWTNSGELVMGIYGSGILNVQNGGFVGNTNGALGLHTGADGTATVDGTDSTWECTRNLLLGRSSGSDTGGTGQLTITDSGTVYVGDAARSGGFLGYLTVSDADSSGTAGGQLYVYNGSTLDHGSSAIVGDGAGEHGWATVDGTGSSWTNSGWLSVGGSGSGTLIVQNGGSVSNTAGWLGYGSDSTGTATVDGTDSSWNNVGELVMGIYGSGILNVQNDGFVGNTNGALGLHTGADGTVTVDGTGSRWINSGFLWVGNSGNGTLNITAGGVVSNSDDGYIGRLSGSTGEVTVDGTGSEWTNNSLLIVGDYGSGTLTISEGGTVNTHFWSVIGRSSGSIGNATVTGAGSEWISNDDLYVGDGGSGTLAIAAGGTVRNSDGFIGKWSGSTGDVTVTGTDSTWENTGNLSLGRSSSSGVGHLTIFHGGTVYVGDEAYPVPDPSAQLIVSDADSSGNDGGQLYVYNGSTLHTITGHAIVGDNADEYGWVTVDGIGSILSISGWLYVGDSGEGTLNVQNGGSVTNDNGWIGYFGTGTATVDGAGSSWTNSESLYVGRSGSGTLTVQNGGSVSNTDGVIGFGASATGMATVDGAGSSWTNSGSLYVGREGSGTLVINNGGSVSNSSGVIGSLSGSTGAVTVTGAGSTWTNNSSVYVGSFGSGTLAITDGGAVSNQFGSIGGSSDSTGEVTVTGTGSTWTNSTSLFVGDSSSGTLAIADGGFVTVAYGTNVAHGASSTGTIAFGSGGGTLTTGWLLASPSQLTGMGTVNTRGLVSDIDLIFDTVSGLTPTLHFDSEPEQDVTVNLDMSDPGNVGDLGAGYEGSGSLTIRDGITVQSRYGLIGYKSGSTGTVTVTGPGSSWTNSEELRVGWAGSGTLTIENGGRVYNTYGAIGDWYASATGTVTINGADSSWTNSDWLLVGYQGSGTLTVENGGSVSNTSGWLGYETGSTGTVLVTGTGSSWTNSGDLYVGDSGSGTLTITDGGVVSAKEVMINDQSRLTIEVSNASQLTVDGGSGKIHNNGTIRIIAGAAPAAGAIYSPIIAGELAYNGINQVLGGTWDETVREFTASVVETGASGTPVSIDLANVQRVLIDDPTTGWSVGTSFLATENSTSLDFTATVPSDAVVGDLEDLLDDQTVQGAWEFTASGGYTPGDPVYLSFDVGSGYVQDDWMVWYYDGANWTEYDASDFIYDGAYAIFAVSSFSGYAVTIAQIIAGYEADFDVDGDVDGDDLTQWESDFGLNGASDADDDGDSDGADFLTWQRQFGNGLSATATSTGVPEPGSLCLLMLGMAIVLFRRHAVLS